MTPVTDVEAVRFGDQTPPDGPILAARVEDLSEKEAVLAALAVAVIAFVVFLVAQARGNHPMVPLSLRPHWPASRYDAHRRTDHADGTDRRAIPTWGSVLFQYPVPWGIT